MDSSLNYTTYPVTHAGRIHHVMVSHSEHAVHMGRAFTSLEWAKLNATEFMDILVVVPPGFRVHFSYAINAALETKFEVFADSVVTGGTTKTARNRNEESTNTNGVVITRDGTVSVVGTPLAEYTWGTLSNPVVGPASGGDQGDAEIMWPQNAVRRFRLTSDANANNVVMRLNFLMEPMAPYGDDLL